MSREAIKLALEALDKHDYEMADHILWKALSQPEPEPVAWLHWLHGPVRLFLNKDQAMMELDRLNREYPVDKDARQMKPLYISPPKRKPLTDEQMEQIHQQYGGNIKKIMRAVESAHGIVGEQHGTR